MAARRDYYVVLGVPPDADSTAIKNAFRQLARRNHADISTEPDAEQRFREIAEAYGVLSDPAKRASYDAQGFAGLAGASAEDLWGGIDLADILGPGMPGLGAVRPAVRAGRCRAAARPGPARRPGDPAAPGCRPAGKRRSRSPGRAPVSGARAAALSPVPVRVPARTAAEPASRPRPAAAARWWSGR